MISVTFALPQESSDFRRAVRDVRSARRSGGKWVLGKVRGAEVLVGHTGVGSEAVAQELGDVLREHRPAFLISAGFAGGLDPQMEVGSLIVATNFSTPALRDVARTLLTSDHCFFGPLHTSAAAVERVADKATLALASGAVAVDMETRAIAGICRDVGIPLLPLRVISDSASTELPVPFACWFDLLQQRPRPFALLTYLALHPGKVRPFYMFVRGLSPARARLSEALLKIIHNAPVLESSLAGFSRGVS